jgi:hypothetical protein
MTCFWPCFFKHYETDQGGQVGRGGCKGHGGLQRRQFLDFLEFGFLAIWQIMAFFAAKIVSWMNNFFMDDVPSKLHQLFFFRIPS